LRPLCDLSRCQSCIAHRSPSGIGEGNCHPHSGEELRVLAPRGMTRTRAGCRADDNLDLKSSASSSGSPYPVVTHGNCTRLVRAQEALSSITPVSHHSPPLPHMHPLGHTWWRSAPTTTSPLESGQPCSAGLASPDGGCSAAVPLPQSCGQTSPDLGGQSHQVSEHQAPPSVRWTMRAEGRVLRRQ